MSWQDELQELDGALASGQISADEYRVRRDRVLAQASGQLPTAAPENKPEPPAVPPARPEPAPKPGIGEHTQIVGEQRGPAEPVDKTQVVSASAEDGDRTQVVPNTMTGPPSPQFPPLPPPPPWEVVAPQRPVPGQPQPSGPGISPPWYNEDLPMDFGHQSWPRQGPEVFEEGSKSNTGKIIAIVLAVVVVLAGAGIAVWYFGIRSDGSTPVAQSTANQPPPTTSPTKPAPNIPKGPFIELPGKVVHNRTSPIAEAVTQKLPAESEAKLLRDNGVVEVGGLVSEQEGLRRGIWAFKVGQDGDAKAVLTAMDKLYEQATYSLGGGPDGVVVRKLAATKPNTDTVFRAHYVTDSGYMVRVEVYGKDADQVETTFNDLLDEQTRKYPPIP